MASPDYLEKEGKAKGLPESWITGTDQRLTGAMRQRFNDNFLAMLPPESSGTIDFYSNEGLAQIRQLRAGPEVVANDSSKTI